MKKPDHYSSAANRDPIIALAKQSNDYRALVCIYLYGGNDSHNMVMPLTNPNRAAYDSERGALAIAANASPINQLTPDWRLHPGMADMKALYDAGKLAILMNVGMLKEPTNRTSFLTRSVRLPSQLFSHNTQQQLWHSLPSATGLVLNGWMGRAIDMAGHIYNPDPFGGVAPGFSLGGKQTQMQGFESTSNDIGSSGPSQISGATAYGTAINTGGHVAAARTRSEHGNLIQAEWAKRVAAAVASQDAIAAQFSALPAAATAVFTALTAADTAAGRTTNPLAPQLAAVARCIFSRGRYRHRRQMFFVGIGGWDDHDNIITGYGPRIVHLNNALKAFWDVLGILGMRDYVTTFTESDFGRALKQNVNGSDHGWGGHALVFGGSVNGGVLYGTPPSLVPGSSNDAGQGRLIPTTSVDQYVATLLHWWGIPYAQLPVILENLTTFTPRTLATLLNQPPPLTNVVPKLAMDLKSSETLDSRFTYSRTNQATQFDKNGNLIIAPHNLVHNSSFAGVQIGGLGELTHFQQNVGNGAYGILGTISGVGVNEAGHPYEEWWIRGTVTGAATLFSEVMSGGSIGGAIPVEFGQVMYIAADLDVVEGSLPVECYWSLSSILADGNWGSPQSISNLTVPISTKKMRMEISAQCVSPNTKFGRVRFRFIMNLGTSCDFKFRLARPQVCQVASVTDRPAYLATSGTPKFLPRFDYNPVTKAKRGLLYEGARTNFVANSVGNGAVAGTPGTMPTGWVVALSSGMQSTLVGRGIENGIPYVDFRLFGTPTAHPLGGCLIRPMGGGVGTTAALNELFTASAFAKIIGGKPKGLVSLQLSCTTQLGTGYQGQDYVFFDKAFRGPLSQTRKSVQRAVPGSVDNATMSIGVVISDVGYHMDFVIRVGLPQLEKGGAVTSPIPTYGASVTRSKDVIKATGANFTSLFGSTFTQGTFHVAGYRSPGHAVDYPAILALNDNTSNNEVYVAGTSNVGATGNINSTKAGGTNGGVSGTWTAGKVNELAAAFGQSDFSISIDGRTCVVSAVGDIASASINQAQIGTRGAGTDDYNGWIEFINYYDVRLPNATLELLTT